MRLPDRRPSHWKTTKTSESANPVENRLAEFCNGRERTGRTGQALDMDDRTRSLRSLTIERSPLAGPSPRPRRWLLPASGIVIALIALGGGVALWLGSPIQPAPSVEASPPQVVRSDNAVQKGVAVAPGSTGSL